jgi:hypothetical protein
MRRFVLLLLLAIAITLIPRSPHASSPAEREQAEALALEERYEEAAALLLPLPAEEIRRAHSLQGLCTIYSLWGKNADALNTCSAALNLPLYAEALKCVYDALRSGGLILKTEDCRTYTVAFDYLLYLKAWQAVAYHRSGRRAESRQALDAAVLISKERPSDPVLFPAITGYITQTFPIFEMVFLSWGEEKKAAKLEHLRIVLTYGGASTPIARAGRAARVLWAEHPYVKRAFYTFAFILLCAAIYIPARRPLRMLARGALSAAKAVPGRVNAWLRPASRPASAHAPALPYALASPPPPMPMYFNYRYPNQAHRIAGYCFAAFWIILLGPLALALLLPAFTLLADFSTSGFQRSYNHFIGILTTSVTWARLWFALLALGVASGLDDDAILQGLAGATTHMLSWMMIRQRCLPAEIDATLSVYGDNLRAFTLQMIHNNDAGRGGGPRGDDDN